MLILMKTIPSKIGKDPFFSWQAQRVPVFGTPEYMKIRFGTEKPTAEDLYKWGAMAAVHGIDVYPKPDSE